MDLAGPLPSSFYYGYKYVSLFVDEYSLHMGVYPIKHKSDQADVHKMYGSDNASIGGMTIREFHSDNGGEFTGVDYSELIRENGARKSTSVSRTPNQNPYAEGAFWKIFGIVRTPDESQGLLKAMLSS